MFKNLEDAQILLAGLKLDIVGFYGGGLKIRFRKHIYITEISLSF